MSPPTNRVLAERSAIGTVSNLVSFEAVARFSAFGLTEVLEAFWDVVLQARAKPGQ